MFKKISLALIVSLVFSMSSHGGMSDDDTNLVNNRFSPATVQKVQLGSKLQQETKQVGRFVYDFSKHGGANNSDIILGKIPSDSVMINSYYQVITRPASASGTTEIMLGASTATDLVNPVSIALLNSGRIAHGALFGDLGGASTMRPSGTSTAQVKFRIQGSRLTAGKIIFWVEYLVGERD